MNKFQAKSCFNYENNCDRGYAVPIQFGQVLYGSENSLNLSLENTRSSQNLSKVKKRLSKFFTNRQEGVSVIL